MPKINSTEKEELTRFLETIHGYTSRGLWGRETVLNLHSELHLVKSGRLDHSKSPLQTLTQGISSGRRLIASVSVYNAVCLRYQTTLDCRPTGGFFLEGFENMTRIGILVNGDKKYRQMDGKGKEVFSEKPYIKFSKLLADILEVRLYISPNT